jgi:hypothetical protein
LVAFVREGLAASVDQMPGATATPRAAVTVRARVEGVGAPIEQSAPGLVLAGPGDVIALHEAQISGRYPAPDAISVDPANFAWIEFQRPDLPWLFTPFAPSGNRLHPWLVLLVLREDEEATLRRVDAAWRLVVRQPTALPDLTQAYAWAHAQFDRPATGSAALTRSEYLTAVSQARSRILCPRQLSARQRYLACLVPSFRASVTAAFGLQPGAAAIELGPAWPTAGGGGAGGPIELPVYAHWRFETGPDGRFEDLVRRLKRPPGPLAFGRRDLDASNPGGGLTPTPTPLRLAQDGVLQSHNSVQFTTTPALSAAIIARLGRRGQLGPPTYGAWHAAAPTTEEGPPWLGGLNHLPIRRVAAALGTQVVQRHQEEFMAACWEQAGEVVQANRQLRLGEMAQAASTSLRARRLKPLRSEGGWALVALAAPALSRIRFGDTLTFEGSLKGSCLKPIAVSGAARKLLRPGGPLQRRLARRINPDTSPPIKPEAVLDALANNRFPDTTPVPTGARLVSAQALSSLRPHPLNEIVRQYSTVVAATRLATCTPPPASGANTFTEHLWAVLDPTVTVPRRVRARLSVPGTLTACFNGLKPILVAPRLPAAMADYLLELSREWLVPGLGGMPPESMVLLEPNPEFIESFFVGLNHEMGRELLWRGFPTDQRGTVFDSFWRHDDRAVPKVHTWLGVLGSHLVPGQAALTVLVMRGELVRRLPRATVYLHERGAGPMAMNQAERVLPTFDRLLEPDTRLIGFAKSIEDVRSRFFLVFQEEPQTLRFGVSSLPDHAWAQPQANDDAASFAQKCVQPPVRLYVKADTLL